jgi:hypothetical protein
MMQHHQYRLQDLENMIPFERDLYVSMLINYIEKENERIQQQQNTARR